MLLLLAFVGDDDESACFLNTEISVLNFINFVFIIAYMNDVEGEDTCVIVSGGYCCDDDEHCCWGCCCLDLRLRFLLRN